MRSRTVSLIAFLLGAACWVHAGAVVEIPGPAGARVYLDGERVGDAPLTLSGLATGTHMVKVEDPTSGASRIFPVQSPARTMVTRRLEVAFGSEPVAPAPAPRVAPPPPVYVPAPAPVYVESSPVYVPPPPVVYVDRPVYWHEPTVSLHYGGSWYHGGGHHSGHYGSGHYGWGGHHSGGHYSGGHHGSSRGHGWH